MICNLGGHKSKVVPYSITSVGLVADPGFLAVSRDGAQPALEPRPVNGKFVALPIAYKKFKVGGSFAMTHLTIGPTRQFIRPPDIICRRTYILPGILLLSFFRRLIPELAEPTKIGHILGSNCNLKTHVQNLRYPLPYISGAQKPPFRTTLQLNGDFNGLYLRN